MNLLIFVMALLMLMASITYSSLSRFVKAEVQAYEWQERIRAQARIKFNHSLYAASKPKEKDDAKKEKPEKADEKKDLKPKTEIGKGTLPGQFLLSPSFRHLHAEELAKYAELFKAIARQLYFEQPFFKNLEKERPQFLDEIMREIIEISERKPISNFNKLMFEKWSDPNLKRAFSLMLRETPTHKRPVKDVIEKEKEEEEKDESIINRNGIVTLNDYFHFIFKPKVRIWLAPKPVLIALFRNNELVDALIRDRNQNYPKLISGIYVKEEIEKYLNETYGGKSAYENFIDYTVTKTRPPK